MASPDCGEAALHYQVQGIHSSPEAVDLLLLVPHRGAPHYLGDILLKADIKHAWVHVLSLVQKEHVMWASPVLEVKMGQLELFHGA